MPYDYMRDHCQILGTENWKFVLCSFVALTDNSIDKLRKRKRKTTGTSISIDIIFCVDTAI